MLVALLLLLALTSVGCSRATDAAPDAQNEQREVIVFAAASTADAMDAVITEYLKLRPQPGLKTSYGPTSTLAQQLAHGATADLFLSADEEWMSYLAEKELVAESKILLGNTLVVVVPAESKLEVADLEGLAGDKIEKVALADPEHVPAGKYARHALEAVGIWDQVRPKIVSGNDVRRALSYVETRAADAGIVYATDALASNRVRVVARIPPTQSGAVRYPLALLKGERDPQPAARSFYEYLFSPDAQAIFQKHGFRAGEALNVAAAESPAP